MTQLISRVALAFSCSLLLLLQACGRGELTGPPNLRLGRDPCISCGMMVQEDRCSSALLIEQDGDRLYVFFDDLGCMFNYEYEYVDELRVLERYVRDYPSREWISAEVAIFFRADREELHTPMGSGTIAVRTPDDAAKLAFKWVAGPMDYRAAFNDRREWMWSMYGKPDGARPAEMP